MLSETRSVSTPMKLAKATATAAIVPVCTTKNRDQPKRKPVAEPYASRRKTYWPPARGIIAASSAQQSAPVIVRTPAMAHAASSHPGDPTMVIDLADTMKIPEPIIDPITIIVASRRPKPRTSLGRSVTVGAIACAGTDAIPRTFRLVFRILRMSEKRADDISITNKDQ